jgi:predicted DCC family thiol-disulfide oxidoreductase YuxK
MNSFVYFLFFLTLAGAFLAVRFCRPVAALIDAWIAKVGRRALASTAGERPKFALIRIGFGAVLTWRASQVLLHLAPTDYRDPPLIQFAILNLATGIALLLGFLCQYTLIFLMVVQWQQGDVVLGTVTLGDNIAAILALLLLVANCGRSLSVDGWIVKRFSRLRAPLLYYGGAPTPASITAAKWLGLSSYWLVCLFSLAVHLNEPAWKTGTAGPLLFTNNFMSRPHEFMADLFAGNHWAVLIARFLMWSMLPWYALLVPCVLIGSIARIYAITFGSLFFVFSLAVLQLGWLPEIELLLWAAIFWSRVGITTPQRFSVVFDHSSKLCERTVRFVRVVDVFDRTKLVSIAENPDWLQSHGISSDEAVSDGHDIDKVTGRLLSGYDVCLETSRHVVLLWPVYPILLMGKWSRLGTVVYGRIARHRQALFGVCTPPSQERAARTLEVAGNASSQLTFVRTMLLHVTFLSVFYLAAIPAPYVGHAGWHNPLADGAQIYGIAPINVFNATDLHLAENWFTLSLLEGDRETLLPILAADGSRLAYHASDRVYFGKTLQWRRRHISQPGCFFDEDQDLMNYLVSIYLRKQGLPKGEYRVRYRQYFEPLADSAQLMRNEYVRQPRELRCTVDFSVTWP